MMGSRILASIHMDKYMLGIVKYSVAGALQVKPEVEKSKKVSLMTFAYFT